MTGMKTLLIWCAGWFCAAFIYAQDPDYQKYGIDTEKGPIPRGLSVGEKAPDFRGPDQNGKSVHLKSLLREGPVVLIFYRGQWCPVCQRYLRNFQDSLDVLLNRNVNVVAVTPELKENVEKTIAHTGVTFSIISDENDRIIRDYGVSFGVTRSYQEEIRMNLFVDISFNNGQEQAVLPVPATYIIGQDGTIQARQFNPDYTKRASIRWILDHLPVDGL